MATYAIIQKNIVTNIIVADNQEIANLFGFAIEYTEANPAHIGFGYDGKTFSQP